MIKYFHSVTLDDKRCRGCTNCIKHCPTEAIRVRKSKATIINERCIDCGVCIRVCPYHAKKAVADRPEDIEKYRYKIALPAPSLYGQYDFSRKKILAGLLKLGFDAIYEVAKGAELVTYTTNMLLDKPGNRYPLISSACPAVVKLIQVRFPDLIDHIIKIESPMEVSAAMAAEEAMKKTGLPRSDIGIFFISPCAAKVTNVKAPYEKSSSAVNGVIAISEIYKNLLEACNRVDDADLDLDLDLAGFQGVVWADSGGEAAGIKKHWRELWKPRYQRIFEAAHKAGLVTILHSCGYIVDILDDLIEAGLDVIQMDQQMNMGLDLLSRRFRGRITFYCPVDIQAVMAFGNESTIRAYCREMVSKLGTPTGGFIAGYYSSPQSVGHTPEAIRAMCEEFMAIDREIREGIFQYV
jgi:Pyruvate/2-oxoacid:ferredoxin oxidoreductase delta subunit